MIYVSAEKFTIEVINSLRFDRMIQLPGPLPHGGRAAGGRHSVHRRKRADLPAIFLM
jgi:hypothetical protein